MAKRRHASKDEILLVPFLDILCSLIGVLVLIIVVLTVSQSQQTEGRTAEEVERAIEYKGLLKQQKESKELQAIADSKIKAIRVLQQQLEEKQQLLARLRKLLSSSDEMKKKNSEMSQNLLKELDNLLLEIDGYKKQQGELKKDIATLLAEIEKKKGPKDARPPPVIVQPSGGGMAAGTKAFFVEASAGKIVLYWDTEKRSQVSSVAEVIIADPSYDAFLKAVKAEPEAKLIFLLRDDGQASYNNAAGWALSTHKFAVGQVAKLPIPGKGDIDLAKFGAFLGTLTPPATAKLLPTQAKPK
jgi:biopolymer transport protein ExbD